MHFVRTGKPVLVRLHKDLKRSIKGGHAWLYSDAVESTPAEPGTVAILLDRREERIACGIYDPTHPIVVRIVRTQPPFSLDDDWLVDQLQRAIAVRQAFFDPARTTGMRLVAGEGDGLPGLIVDQYDRVAVIKMDGGAPEAFYQPAAIADWLQQQLGLDCVVLRSRQRGRAGEALVGSLPAAPVPFLENGLRFTADVVHGQKTGFFLDQRDNRELVQRFSDQQRVLNLFSFNGGFSVSAGRGGATQVTSVDVAGPAIEAAAFHWQLNQLATPHQGVVGDCFDFLEESLAARREWDFVICDPPSFAPSEKSRPRALAAYARLAQLASRVTRSGGLLALASCSSHIDAASFASANFEGLARARRRATLLAERSLPIDHPTPFAMPELRYLKFHLLRLD